ncbi:MAG: type II CAAX prenyl endopeptidase Rce1 family protein [Bacteroidota bacterium]
MRLQKILLFILVLSVYLLFSYNYFQGWWYSAIGTSGILILAWLIWKKNFLIKTGLKINIRDVGITIVLTALILYLGYKLVNAIGEPLDLKPNCQNWRGIAHIFFYTLNEEIVLGAMLLFYLRNKFPNLGDVIISAVVAFLFAMGHFVFYQFVFIPNQGILLHTTMLTLFFTGMIRNALILKYNHVGFSWAIHFGWMAVFFGCYPVNTTTGEHLKESELFNIFLGSPVMVSFSGIIMFGAVYLLLKDK